MAPHILTLFYSQGYIISRFSLFRNEIRTLVMVSLYSDAPDKTPHNPLDFPVVKRGYPGRKGNGFAQIAMPTTLDSQHFLPVFFCQPIPDRENGAIKAHRAAVGISISAGQGRQ